MATNLWWVGADVTHTPTTYAFQAPNRTAAQKIIPAGFLEGPFQTKAEAEAFINTGLTNVPGAKESTQSKSQITVPNPLTSADQFLAMVSNANLWIRVGQVALGLLLIAIGTAQLTHAVPIATTIAKAVK